MAYANLCQQLYENITMSRDDVSAEAMQYYVEYQWVTMIKNLMRTWLAVRMSRVQSPLAIP